MGKSDEDPATVLSQLLLFWLLSSVIGTAAMAATLVVGGYGETPWALALGTAILAPTLLLRMGQGAFLGLGRIGALNRSEIAGRAILLAATVVLWLIDALTIESALACLVFSNVLAGLYLAWQLRELLCWPKPNWLLSRSMLRMGFAFAGGSICMIMLGRVGVWIVNAELSAAEVGTYFAVMRLSEMVPEVATAVGVAIFSHGVRTEDPRLAALETIKTARCVTASLMPVAVAVILFAEPVLTLVFGESYLAGSDAFRILVVGGVLSCFSMMLYPGLSSQGEARWGVRIFGPGTLLAAVACWLLAPGMGIEGAALAMAAAQIAVAVAHVVVYHRLYDIPYRQIVLPQREDLVTIKGFLMRRRKARTAPAL